MTYKYQKQYRLPGFDYSSNNAYYITVCTKNKVNFFGEVSNNQMFFTDIGFFAEQLLKEVNGKLKHLKIHEYVVTPNHIHFIAVIFIEENHFEFSGKDGIHPLIKNSISSFTNHYKGKVKRWCNENGLQGFEWLSRFRDRIIRDSKEYEIIKYHIINNIRDWHDDPEK